MALQFLPKSPLPPLHPYPSHTCRHVMAQMNVDLSACTFHKFSEVFYETGAGKTCVVFLVPDIWTVEGGFKACAQIKEEINEYTEKRVIASLQTQPRPTLSVPKRLVRQLMSFSMLGSQEWTIHTHPTICVSQLHQYPTVGLGLAFKAAVVLEHVFGGTLANNLQAATAF